MPGIRWLPLESNPEVMNKFLKQLGVPSSCGISDIISLDEELLSMVPTPVYALLLLFPISPKYLEYCAKQEEDRTNRKHELDPDVFFMHQTIGNACGTVALIHAIANSLDYLNLDSSTSVVKKFIDESKFLNPKDKSEALEKSLEIGAAHEASAREGQTETPNIDDKIDLHFIALVQVKNKLFELDGRKSTPVYHGSTSPESFLKDAVVVCKQYMERDSENLNFTALSFGAL